MSEDWTEIILGELCNLIKGTSPTQKTLPGAFPLIVTAAAPLTSNAYQFDGEAVCVPMVSSTGHGHASLKRVHYASGRFAVANIIVACIVKDPMLCDTRYLWLYLQARKDEILVPRMQGTANVSLSQRGLAKVPVLLPPLFEQRRIVDLIGSLDSALEAAEERVAASISAQTATLAGMYESLDSEFVTAASLMSYMIGGSWGGAPGVECPTNALGPSAFAGAVTDVDPTRGSARSLSMKKLAARALAKDDIIIERSGGSPTQPVGRVIRATSDLPSTVHSDFMRLLRVDPDKADPRFVFWALRMRYSRGDTVEFQKQTTNIRNLNITDYLHSPFRLPRRSEDQRLFGALGEALSAAVAEAQGLATSLHTLRENLLTALLSGEHEIPASYDDLMGVAT